MPTLSFAASEAFYILWHMALAFVLALPMGINRETSSSQSAGFRTFPLVAVATCAFVLTAIFQFDSEEAIARVFYGVITGVGFIGGGAIFKSKDRVEGTATAASLWGTSAMGLAVAFNRFEIAIVLSVMMFLTFRLKSISNRVNRE